MPGVARVYYSASGSEANEKAFKMIRQISHFHYGGKKSKILRGEGNGRKWREKAVRHVCIYNLFGEARRRNCSRLQRAILEVRGTHVDTVHKMHTKQ